MKFFAALMVFGAVLLPLAANAASNGSNEVTFVGHDKVAVRTQQGRSSRLRAGLHGLMQSSR